MSKVLVVDDVAIIRDPIAASLRLAGFETVCAADGEEALALTRQHRPDVILLDISMPKMNGLAFLKVLRADPAIAHTRVILLTALSEKKYIVAAMTMGVRDYLLKSRFRLAELIDRINKPSPLQTSAPAAASPVAAPGTRAAAPVAASSASAPTTQSSPAQDPSPAAADEIPKLLTREQFLERVKEVFKTKTLSGVVAQVIALASSPRGEMTQLAALIAQDPMLSVRVLQTANSASYSTGTAVMNIPDAIRKLGFTTVRNVAAALGVFDCMPEAGADGFDPIRCWQHSFAVAQMCERLALAAVPEKSGTAYVMGLCHDLGEIFIRTQFGGEYRQVIETAERLGRPRDELFGLMLGMTETQMISEVLKTIALPAAIREPIEVLHSGRGAKTADPLARLLWLAENFANGALIASNPKSEVEVLTQAQCKAASGTPNPILLDPASLRSQVLSLTITLARLSRSEEAKLMVPLFPATSARIWVACAAGIANCDPVSLALSSLAGAELKSRLPGPDELQGFDGLVVLSSSTNAPGMSSSDVAAVLAREAKRGRPVTTLCLCPAAIPLAATDSAVQWRGATTLSDLAGYVETISKARSQAAA